MDTSLLKQANVFLAISREADAREDFSHDVLSERLIHEVPRVNRYGSDFFH